MFGSLKRLRKVEDRMFRVAEQYRSIVQIDQAGFSSRSKQGFRFPIYSLIAGKKKARARAGFIAGVHGLEVIGVQVLLHFLEHALERFKKEIEKGQLSLSFLPLLNPGGLAMRSRSNPAGVDLMRNAGQDAERAPFFFGGHFISPLLPYYRGKSLQPEARTLLRFIHQSFYGHKKGLMPVFDIHSGFGSRDQIWWPYAGKSDAPVDQHLFERLTGELRRAHPEYIYTPQSESYMIHGDLWDRIYDSYQIRNAKNAARLLPLTLEISTWTELRERPRRLLSKKKLFNPPRKKRRDALDKHTELLASVIDWTLTSP